MVYGKPYGFVSGGFINVESTDASTSSTDQPLDQAKHGVGVSVFVYVLNYDISISVCDSNVKTDSVVCDVSTSNSIEFNFFDMFDELFGNSDACDTHETPSIPQVTTSETPSLISKSIPHACSSEKSESVCQENKSEKCNTSSNNKHICFNCGVGGHIARNCQNRIFVNYLSPRGENESRGRSLIRKSSRTRSRNNNQKDDKNRKRAGLQTNKKVFIDKAQNSLPKPNKAQPRSVSSKSNSRSSTNFGRKSSRFV